MAIWKPLAFIMALFTIPRATASEGDTMSVPIRYSPMHEVMHSATAMLDDQAGWLMPRAFGSNPNGRPAVGILDRSHHGLIMVEGPAAEDLLASKDVPRPLEIGRGA